MDEHFTNFDRYNSRTFENLQMFSLNCSEQYKCLKWAMQPLISTFIAYINTAWSDNLLQLKN